MRVPSHLKKLFVKSSSTQLIFRDRKYHAMLVKNNNAERVSDFMTFTKWLKSKEDLSPNQRVFRSCFFLS